MKEKKERKRDRMAAHAILYQLHKEQNIVKKRGQKKSNAEDEIKKIVLQIIKECLSNCPDTALNIRSNNGYPVNHPVKYWISGQASGQILDIWSTIRSNNGYQINYPVKYRISSQLFGQIPDIR